MGEHASADGPSNEPVWWYRDGARTAGLVPLAELRRLADGPLGPATLVWRKTFGDAWRRFDATLASDRGADGPPPIDHGRWTGSFARFEAEPAKAHWSALGLFGPVGYLVLGMWRRALVLWSASLAARIVLLVLGAPVWSMLVPAVLIAGFCVLNLKRDLFHHRVLGEPMWPSLRPLAKGYACGGLAAVLVVAMVALGGRAQARRRRRANGGGRRDGWPWRDGGRCLDGGDGVGGRDRRRLADRRGGGRRPRRIRRDQDHRVRRQNLRVDLSKEAPVEGILVYADRGDPSALITLQRHWDEKHEAFSLDLFLDDRFIGNLTYLRPT